MTFNQVYKVFIVLMILILTVGFIRLYQGSQKRAQLAREMSSPEIQVIATDALNLTLQLQLIDDDQTRCNRTVGEILGDAHLRGELVGDGFTQISCGSLKAGMSR